VHEISADAYKTRIIPHPLLMNWNLAGSRAPYITFVYVYTCTFVYVYTCTFMYVYTCTLTGKPVQYEHVHAVQCCTEGPALHVDM